MISKEEFYEVYLRNKCSQKRTAQELKMAERTICNLCRKFKIKDTFQSFKEMQIIQQEKVLTEISDEEIAEAQLRIGPPTVSMDVWSKDSKPQANGKQGKYQSEQRIIMETRHSNAQ